MRTRHFPGHPEGPPFHGDFVPGDEVARRELDLNGGVIVDATFGSVEEGADNVGLLVIAGAGPKRFVLCDASRRMSFLDSIAAIKALLVRTDALAGVKRASNILGIEEKKDKKSHAGDYDTGLLSGAEETRLAAAIEERPLPLDTVSLSNSGFCHDLSVMENVGYASCWDEHGLVLLDLLSGQWSVRPESEGKTVWFCLDEDAEPPGPPDL